MTRSTLMVLLRVTFAVTMAKSVGRRFGRALSVSRSAATGLARRGVLRSRKPSTERTTFLPARDLLDQIDPAERARSRLRQTDHAGHVPDPARQHPRAWLLPLSHSRMIACPGRPASGGMRRQRAGETKTKE